MFPIYNLLRINCSFISGISLLGTPTEIYVYGVQYMFIFFGVLTMGVAMTYVFLPVFHDLKLTSTYEVIEIKLPNVMSHRHSRVFHYMANAFKMGFKYLT